MPVFRQRQIQSPLDVLNGKAPPRPAQAVPRPVGRLQLQFTPRAGELAADVKLVVLGDDRYVHLNGIVVRQPRAGWITLEIQPLESWERPMRWLTREQRQRMESPTGYSRNKSAGGTGPGRTGQLAGDATTGSVAPAWTAASVLRSRCLP